ncbi:uncharacterized protein LOC128866966 [Anastrepha ludens]|uniref:uncharacterized protein LOC128866966 n=1 Tax=Anastrepha ludens TaxID=28586 RepID=UPI0023AF02A9|nr:uncharacterized protein LOC128866966 [Anastrepha ludens]
MVATACEPSQVNFVPERLAIPLLLLTRNRMKNDNFRPLSEYISRKRNLYHTHCNLEDKKETKSQERARKLIGAYPAPSQPCFNRQLSKISKHMSKTKPYHPPPNIYNTTYEPYARRRGLGGAYWNKLPGERISTFVQLVSGPPKRPKSKWVLYNFPQMVERLNMSYNKHKGVFLTNARSRIASTRFMITDPKLVYHSPSDPSPAEYNVVYHTIAYNMAPEEYMKRQNPHLFLRQSCVPEQNRSLIPRHLSFLPAVGRYEIRFPKHCPCRRKIFTPGLRLIIDREKRKKSRHLPYKKIKVHLHCEPDWHHVPGHGHAHVFRYPKSKLRKPRPLKRPKKMNRLEKPLQLFHDHKYINMIVAPHRQGIGNIVDDGSAPKIRFNCIIKVKMPKQFRHERKKLFGGSAPRFSDQERHQVVLTTKQLEQLKNTLPVERQFRDHSITGTPLTEIKSRLFEIPARLKPTYEPTLRKRTFKFAAPPAAKLLVTKKDLLPHLAAGAVYKAPRAYNKPVELESFLKTTADRESSFTE